jgi:hopene-associated glycosyltransferase HpnB
MTGLAMLSLLVWTWLLLGHGRFWQAGPVLQPPFGQQGRETVDDPPAVAIVVPARDEAPVIEATLRSLLAQDFAGPLHIILVDDGSTDGTGDLARRLAGTDVDLEESVAEPAHLSRNVMTGIERHGASPNSVLPRQSRRLTVLTGSPRPAGWSGKLWAVAQGIAAAGGPDFALLTDADIVHEPDHLRTLVTHADRSDLDLVSEMVALGCVSAAEQALVPAFVFFFQLLYPFEWVNNPLRKTAAAAGGTILLRRRALLRIGGIEAVRGALIDDVALAAAVKTGGRIWLGHSTLARSVRPYPGVADIWRMIARTAYVQLRFSPLLLIGTTLAMALVWLVPPAAVLSGHVTARCFGIVAWAMLAGSYLPTLRRFGRSPLWAPFLPLVALFYMAATIGSAVNHYTGHGVAWKGRAYRGSAA